MNISSFSPSHTDLTLLEKGLSFIPTRKSLPLSNILNNQNRLIRSLKLNYYFKHKKDNSTVSTNTITNPTNRNNIIENNINNILDDKTETNKHNKSLARQFTEIKTWTPSNHQLCHEILKLTDNIKFTTATVLENFTKNPQSNLMHLNSSKYDSIKLNEVDNLTKNERESLFNLRKNQNLIIKPADKGGATVLMDKTNYIVEAQKQLNDAKYYTKLLNPIYTKNVPKIRIILTDMLNQNFINREQYNYLIGPEIINNRTFYLLPKIHKKPETWPQPGRMPPGRPIVSDVGSETYRISEYIDYYLNPLACKHETYIKNTYEFVNKIKDFAVTNDYLLVTGDIESLYTNMNLDRSLNCVKELFNKYKDPTRPDKQLLDLLEISLKYNDFEFNGEFYLQTMGCAMGKRFAPALANIYLLDFDSKAKNDFKIKPILFFRFLDDVYFLWPGGVDSLMEYENFLNSLIPDIRIKLEYSTVEVPFLDTIIYKNNNKLQTRTYFKPTDTHQLLHTKSFHAKHTFQGLLKSQLIRFKRLSSTLFDYNTTCKTLFAVLTQRGYTLSTMRQMQYDIWFNYENKENVNNDKIDFIPIITDYCKIGLQLANEYKKLCRNDQHFNNVRFITAYKNDKNLKQLLTRSKMQNITHKEGAGFVSCGQAHCFTCRFHANDSTHFYNIQNNTQIKIENTIYCKSSNIIYLISCTKCNVQYIGETARTLRERMNDHRSAINKRKNTPIGLHFNTPGHSYLNMRVVPIELINNKTNPTNARKIREKYWQYRLKTLHPIGLNNLNEEHNYTS